eukprot:5533634-Ditylum_brightwellii.AAC.1
MAPFSLRIHLFIRCVADPGVNVAVIVLVVFDTTRQDGLSLKCVEILLFLVFKRCGDFLINDCVEVFVSIRQGLTRLGLATAETHLLILAGSVLPFMMCASFVLVHCDPVLICQVVAIPMVLEIVMSLAIGVMSWRILSPIMVVGIPFPKTSRIPSGSSFLALTPVGVGNSIRDVPGLVHHVPNALLLQIVGLVWEHLDCHSIQTMFK